MEEYFEQLTQKLSKSPLHIDILHEIAKHLEQQTNESLSQFIEDSFQSLNTLEDWAWDLFCQESHQWIHQANYLYLLDRLSSFNSMLIFHSNHIEPETKSSLLIPKNIQLVDKIFENIEKIDHDNDQYLTIISCWFDNLGYLIHEHTQFESSPIIVHLSQCIGRKYVLSDQYKSYLTQLRQSQISTSIFTAKLLFYIKTCSFVFRMYSCSKVDRFPFTADQIFSRYRVELFDIILVHSRTVNSWNKQLLTCMAHLIDLSCAVCWWGNDKITYINTFISCEQILNDYVQALIRIIACKSFHESITSQWCNDETILIDSALIFLVGIVSATKNLTCFLRSETNLSDIILSIAQKSCFDRISLCAYGILVETLSDEQLKQVKITHNVLEFFFHTLQLAWNHPTQRYKRVTISQLLEGFLTLSKNDVIQEKAAKSNKITLLIEMSDKYPITLDILWSLSFNQDIQQQLRSNPLFMHKLSLLREASDSEKMRKTIFGLLWNLELNHGDRPITDVPSFDIMISYSHKDEVICKQIYEELLKFKYRVWIDFDQIHGNIMDAMAEAIDQSHAVLICMSEQYRRSNYCRAEAHYAFQRQRQIVPILIQEHYQPDGWLLFLVGQLLYVDFTKYEFPRGIELLIKELQAPLIQGSQPLSVPPDDPTETEPRFPIVELSTLPNNILDWTQFHTRNWLLGNNLKQMARLLIDYNGRDLFSLNELILTNESQQVLTLLQDDCKRKLNENISFIEFARFRTLIEQRSQLMKSQQWLSKDSIIRKIPMCDLL